MALAFAGRRSRPPRPPHLVRRHALAGLLRDDGTVDWSPWYLTEEEDLGQSGEQCQIIHVLRSSLHMLAEERGWSSVLVETDNFFAWVEDEPYVQVSPDVFLVDDPPPGDQPLPRRWETWRDDHRAPRFAVEIVSSEWRKDYEINPARYDHLGVDELVLADRDAFAGNLPSRGPAASTRVPFRVFRRNAEDRLEEVYRGPGPAYCAEIDAWLSFQWSSPARPRVRVSRGEDGRDIVLTGEEKARAEAQRARDEAQKTRAAEEKARAAEEKTRAAEEKTRAAEEKARAADEKARNEALKARDAEERARTQAAELAALRARIQELEKP